MKLQIRSTSTSGGAGRQAGWGWGRGLRKARVIAREVAIQDALGLGEGSSIGQAEFSDEAVLQRAEEALDPAFGLGRRGRDPADAEVVEGASDLRGGHGALQLLHEAVGRAALAMKDAVTIGVGGGGDPAAADELAEDAEVAVGIFLEAEDGGEDRARGVIEGGVEDEPGAAIFEPAMPAPVEEDQESGLRHAFAAPPMFGSAPRPGAGEAGRPEDPLDGGP